jgi:hypothetical protein
MVGFNEKKENPLLEKGWKKLHHHHGFPKNVEIMFGYYEEGLFAINSFKELDCNRDDLFLPFHSRSLMPKLTKVWEFILSSEEKNNTSFVKFLNFFFLQIHYISYFNNFFIMKLQALGGTLSAYLAKRATQMDNILLIGDNDQTEEFQISNFNH